MRIVFFSAALVVSTIAVGATPIDGWYNSLFAGYTNLPDNIGVTNRGLNFNHAEYEPGYHVGGRFGYQCNPLRYEGEITFLEAEFNKFHVDGVPQSGIDGQTSGTFGMANIYYDFPDIVPAVQPFLGLGLGYGWIKASLSSNGPFDATSLSGSEGVFAYQATGGLTYNFSENYAANIAYRYIGTDRLDNFGKVFQANLATLGIVYRFNANNYK